MDPRRYPPKKTRRHETSGDSDEFVFGSRVTHTQQTKKTENNALVLDYLPEGRDFGSKKREPIIQCIGDKWFTLLEVVPRKHGDFPQFSEIQLPRSEKSNSGVIRYIKQRISVDNLTNTAYEALEEAILRIVNKNERRFVAFFNRAQPITNRIHSLQLIPGIGKKLMWEFLQVRKQLPFVSFQDIEERVKISDIRKMLVKRILLELEGEEKHYLFTIGPEKR